ncbi:hypothetical protein J6590_094334, partial [Homalodisca vitripennis]
MTPDSIPNKSPNDDEKIVSCISCRNTRWSLVSMLTLDVTGPVLALIRSIDIEAQPSAARPPRTHIRQ